ncbi:hypothetical protein SynBIOSE41_03919 [Synechococcus sp. BIOS-E4-1]|nr:hypothetical protein SynBIOSE41_03919 [Synechococcus sp. BIOS-E4-1]
MGQCTPVRARCDECALESTFAIIALSEYPLRNTSFLLLAMIETTVLDFKLSKTFEEYRDHMEAPD